MNQKRAISKCRGLGHAAEHSCTMLVLLLGSTAWGHRDFHKAVSIAALNLGRNTLPQPVWAHRQAVGVSSPTLMFALSDKPSLLFKRERSSCTQQTMLTWSTDFRATLWWAGIPYSSPAPQSCAAKSEDLLMGRHRNSSHLGPVMNPSGLPLWVTHEVRVGEQSTLEKNSLQ